MIRIRIAATVNRAVSPSFLGMFLVSVLLSCQGVQWEPRAPVSTSASERQRKDIASTQTVSSSEKNPGPGIVSNPPTSFSSDSNPSSSKSDARTSRGVTPSTSPPRQALRGRHIVVDAGHGGKDPGAIAPTGTYEKTINLAMAQRIARLLRDEGAKITLSRNTDKFLDLDLRASIATHTKADLFLSLHADAAERKEAFGTTLYLSPEGPKEGRRIAEGILRSFEAAKIPSRGVKTARFRVLVGHERPGILLECGFLSNHREARLLATAVYREKLARAIVQGIVKTMGKPRN